MTVPSLHELYDVHEGKVSDKWSIYLDVYEHLFGPYRDKPVRLLEIGVQNGGSLEIWSQYFREAVSFVGCDIDPNCGKLRFDDPRISVIVGDASTSEVQAAITATGPDFDVIIDDGSHTSSDIVRSFARYFPGLRRGGIYVAEDLHCGYWREFGGGLFDPASSMSFFKRLVDVVNHEHWGVQARRSDILRTFAREYGAEFGEEWLAQVHSIEFVNSMCIVRKDDAASNVLGSRHFSGMVEAVVQRGEPAPAGKWKPPLQSENRWSRLDPLPEEEFQLLTAEVERNRSDLAQLRSELTSLREQLADSQMHVQALQGTLSWRITRPLRAMRTMVGPRIKSKNG